MSKTKHYQWYQGWWVMYVKGTKTLYVSINYKLFKFQFKKA